MSQLREGIRSRFISLESSPKSKIFFIRKRFFWQNRVWHIGHRRQILTKKIFLKHILPRPNLRALACKATPVIRVVTYFVSRSISTRFRNSLSQTFHIACARLKLVTYFSHCYCEIKNFSSTNRCVTSMECTATHFCLERENKIGFHSLFLAALATLCLHPP